MAGTRVIGINQLIGFLKEGKVIIINRSGRVGGRFGLVRLHGEYIFQLGSCGSLRFCNCIRGYGGLEVEINQPSAGGSITDLAVIQLNGQITISTCGSPYNGTLYGVAIRIGQGGCFHAVRYIVQSGQLALRNQRTNVHMLALVGRGRYFHIEIHRFANPATGGFLPFIYIAAVIIYPYIDSWTFLVLKYSGQVTGDLTAGGIHPYIPVLHLHKHGNRHIGPVVLFGGGNQQQIIAGVQGQFCLLIRVRLGASLDFRQGRPAGKLAFRHQNIHRHQSGQKLRGALRQYIIQRFRRMNIVRSRKFGKSLVVLVGVIVIAVPHQLVRLHGIALGHPGKGDLTGIVLLRRSGHRHGQQHGQRQQQRQALFHCLFHVTFTPLVSLLSTAASLGRGRAYFTFFRPGSSTATAIRAAPASVKGTVPVLILVCIIYPSCSNFCKYKS